MLWSELCYSRGAWPVVLEAVWRLVVGKNYDLTIQHYWSYRIGSVVYRSEQPIGWEDVPSTPVHIALS